MALDHSDWCALFEFTRVNIELTILYKNIEAGDL